MEKFIFIAKSFVDETLAGSPVQGKHSLEPLRSFAKTNGVPISILEDTDVENEAEVHMTKADLWQCIAGEATFTIGGELVNSRVKKNADGTEDSTEIFAETISEGREQVVREGDWLWIPAGLPHSHRAKGIARFFVIKVPEE
jgi:mannose-6-phosphate isomerase-like protein (cupin superfamily)